MSAAHTPGPWVLTDGDRFESSCVITTHLRLDESIASIAEVETDWIEPLGSEQRANARLIAAAPDLLFALERMVRQHGSNFISYSGDHPVSVARAAIAKATGEAT